MDPHEILKVTRAIKDRGNDFFKRGQLLQAQRDYTEVLAMLTEEIIFTGDDQRKEKETLLLTAHLKLAQCALRLGDNARVVYHCNTALSMDSNNVKTHFRKARAFENRAEFAEALEGYRHVLTLESHNETVQRQLSECQKKLDSQKAEEQMSNRMTGQVGQDIEDEDIEVVYENSETDPQIRYNSCEKNPGHKNFINLNDFKIEHLPPDYRDQELFDHIRNHQSQITVMLKVWVDKQSRQQGCGPRTGRNNSGNPGPGKRGRAFSCGSGFVHHVQSHTEDERPCPCQACYNSGSAERRWAEITVWTTAHNVLNETEASRTECYFFYDSEQIDMKSCPMLSSGVIEQRSKVCDTCSLKFITHDDNFLQQLDTIWHAYRKSLHRIALKYSNPAVFEPEGSLQEQREQLWQRCTELTTEFGQLVKRLVDSLSGDQGKTIGEYARHRKDRKENFKDDGLAKLLKDKMTGGVQYQEEIKSHQNAHKVFCGWLEGYSKTSKILENIRETEIAACRLLEGEIVKWQLRLRYIEQRVVRLRHWFDENVIVPSRKFNKDHRLTVIVSHPHGCSKKITIGETIETTNERSGELYELTYTTPTCRGSSGAYVLFLGSVALVGGHIHSAKKFVGLFGQLNMSTLGVNL